MCAYLPLRMEPRAGQQSGVAIYGRVNSVPPWSNRASVFGMYAIVPWSRWSSVTMTITFGGFATRDGVATTAACAGETNAMLEMAMSVAIDARTRFITFPFSQRVRALGPVFRLGRTRP